MKTLLGALLLMAASAGAAPIVTNNPAYSAPTACTGTLVTPAMTTQQIQAAINAGGAGRIFCWAGGLYTINAYLSLPSNSQQICAVRRSCVLTGNGTFVGGFTTSYGTSGVRIQGFTMRDFATPNGFPEACMQLRAGGVMEDNDISGCNTAISMNAGATARGNHLHHNRCHGVAGGPGENMRLELNEIDNNNTSHADIGIDCAGVKIVGSSAGASVTFAQNFVHDNYGQGLWCDGNCFNSVIELNVVTGNFGAGIDWEISRAVSIRSNVLAGNASAEYGLGLSCWHSAQILVNNSIGVLIYDNTIESNRVNALCLTNSTRSERPEFPQALSNVSVHDNTFKLRGPALVGVTGDRIAVGISFSNNTYYLDNAAGRDWAFYGDPRTRAQWQAAGQDATGTFLTW